MTASVMNGTFKKSVYVSLGAHALVLLLIVLSPHFPKPSKKGFIQYIPLNMVGPGGDGSGGGGIRPQARLGNTPVVKRETLKELTTPQKAKDEPKSDMRYPTEKPKTEPKKKAEKKGAITRQDQAPAGARPQAGSPQGSPQGTTTQGGFGTGLRIGTGNGSGGGGWGPGGPGLGGGLGNFPYTYYLNIITEKVSGNWFTSLVDPGVSGNFQTVVYFRIQRDGQIAELKIEQASGVMALDLSAMRAVRASAPFPPLPRDYQDNYLVIHLMFEHSK
jgi:TonB family protein